MIKKIMVLIAVITFVICGVHENIQIQKSFNLKKEKVLKVINSEIEKRENLNSKMEKLASDFNAEYENNINSNLIVVREKIENAKNEKELLKIALELE